MRSYLFIISFLFIQTISLAQSVAERLISEGIELHDRGQYADAIKKYNEALTAEPNNIMAMYEKSMTLLSIKSLEESIELSKSIISKFPGNPILKGVFVNYGTALDDQGKAAEAIKIYDKGLKMFPGYFLLNFNKGITYAMMKEADKAYECYQLALISNPLHSSSYYRVSEMLQNTNHIPAMFAAIMHLVLEPQSDRSKTSFLFLQNQIRGNVKKTGENTTTIFLSADMLDSKKTKRQPDNFRSTEMLFSMSSALDKDSTMNTITKTEIEKFDLRLQLLIGSLLQNNKGFFSERYVPFFKILKEKGFTMLVSRLVYANTNDERNSAWLKTHVEETNDFYQWLKAYRWPAR